MTWETLVTSKLTHTLLTFERLEMKFRYEKTDYGWKAYFLKDNAYIYFGHYQTIKRAKEALDYLAQNGYPDESSPLRQKYLNDYPYIQF